jgi:hypothetical protein
MTRSPSKVVRGAILSAFAGVISIGISPGTVAIVLSGISPSIGELAGLSGVLTATPDSQPAVNISSAGDNASGSGLSTELLLVHAASDVDGSASAGNGVSAGPPSLSQASPLAFGAQLFGSIASVTGILADLPRLGTASRVGASLPIADKPFIINENAASSSTPADSVSCSSSEQPAEDSTASREPDLCGPVIVLKDIPGGDGVGPAGPTVNDPFPSEPVVPNRVTPVASPLPLFDDRAGDDAQALTPAQEVPAPATLLLFLAGMPGLLLLRRRGRPIDDSTG